ncbi:ankyrin repeat domain-containing protein [Nocardia jejuensis]|uniref:ankyrin repeat domain-containing protein n=1 Tax=Nocardia jejuensis TaxID=328049 RepID=UPI0008304BB0|nr:ankyrin repeat domain-containing protein [Nocardia jejuensis]
MSADDDARVIELAGKIFDLARNGDAAGLASYVDAGVPVNLTNERGDTLLMLAAYYGHSDAVAVLLERGADANGPEDAGATPLAGAVFKGDEKVVRLLLAAGADPDAGNPSARDSATMFERTELLKFFSPS